LFTEDQFTHNAVTKVIMLKDLFFQAACRKNGINCGCPAAGIEPAQPFCRLF